MSSSSAVAIDMDDPKIATVARTKLLDAKPFPWTRLDNVIQPELLSALEEELMGQNFLEKDNDLFSFFQTKDLASSTSPTIKKVVQALYGPEFRSLVSKITGLELSDQVDVTASVYQNTNTLLCHDDKLLGRRVAYILYLVPEDWSAEADGGTLDLFSVDTEGRPCAVTNRLEPKRNALAMFNVSDKSFHQVAEVTGDRYRLSINGWFHGPVPTPAAPVATVDPTTVDPTTVATDDPAADAPAVDTTAAPVADGVDAVPSNETATKLIEVADGRGLARFVPDLLPLSAPDTTAIVDLTTWINPMFLGAVADQVCESFEGQSFVSLRDFLIPDRAAALNRAMLMEETEWEPVGPCNKRRLSMCTTPKSQTIQDFLVIVRSRAFADLLGRLTGLVIDQVNVRVRRFDAGCYELAFDGDVERDLPGLDVVLGATQVSDDAGWEDMDVGGAMVWADADGDEAIAVEQPAANALTLAYRAEPGTFRFVKYVNSKAPGPRLDIMLTCRVTAKEGDDSDTNEKGTALEMVNEEEEAAAPEPKRAKVDE